MPCTGAAAAATHQDADAVLGHLLQVLPYELLAGGGVGPPQRVVGAVQAVGRLEADAWRAGACACVRMCVCVYVVCVCVCIAAVCAGPVAPSSLGGDVPSCAPATRTGAPGRGSAQVRSCSPWGYLAAVAGSQCGSTAWSQCAHRPVLGSLYLWGCGVWKCGVWSAGLGVWVSVSAGTVGRVGPLDPLPPRSKPG